MEKDLLRATFAIDKTDWQAASERPASRTVPESIHPGCQALPPTPSVQGAACLPGSSPCLPGCTWLAGTGSKALQPHPHDFRQPKNKCRPGIFKSGV